MKTLIQEKDKADVLDRLARVRPNSARRWGKMTAHQMICHLSDAFRVALGERTVSPAGGVFHRTLLKWGALYVPLRWPRHFPTRPEVDQHAGGTPPAEFARDVEELTHLLDRFCVQARTYGTHPNFGPLTYAQWMRWGYLHMDHHLRQFGA